MATSRFGFSGVAISVARKTKQQEDGIPPF